RPSAPMTGSGLTRRSTATNVSPSPPQPTMADRQHRSQSARRNAGWFKAPRAYLRPARVRSNARQDGAPTRNRLRWWKRRDAPADELEELLARHRQIRGARDGFAKVN